MKVFLTLLISLMFTVGLTGCDNDGPAEDFGERVDESVEDAGDAIEDTADDAEDAVDDMNN